jgi:phage terminase large subunit
MRTTEKVIMCYNPTARFYAHEKVIPLSDTRLIISNFSHNLYLSENIKNEILSYKDPNGANYDLYRWNVMGLGKTGQIEGLCFPKVFQIVPSEFPVQPKKRCYGLDWGFSGDPLVLCQIAQYDNRLFARELIYETGLLNINLNELLLQLGISKSDVIVADRSSPQNIADMRRLGWNIIASQGKEIQFGINKLNEQNLYLTSDSKNAWIEQQRYIYNQKTGNPIDKYNHFWDALRYANEGISYSQITHAPEYEYSAGFQ